jgi:hypothetical protein
MLRIRLPQGALYSIKRLLPNRCLLISRDQPNRIGINRGLFSVKQNKTIDDLEILLNIYLFTFEIALLKGKAFHALLAALVRLERHFFVRITLVLLEDTFMLGADIRILRLQARWWCWWISCWSGRYARWFIGALTRNSSHNILNRLILLN